MKVIVSHDVDHLHPSEHFFNDLFLPKMWVRSMLECLHRQISLKVFINRFLLTFGKRLNRIVELCEYDKSKGVKATYFFGMDNVLGMSYKKEKALPYIKYVIAQGFDAGVHGCNFDDAEAIKKEHDTFALLTGELFFGVRNHYVRYNTNTFQYMSDAGYRFDTTEFNKLELEYKAPYKVGNMWEFPLSIMDVYVLHHNYNEAQRQVRTFVDEVSQIKGAYLTILLHDTSYNPKTHPEEKAFYEWLIDYLICKGAEFVTYKEAIIELENEGKHKRS